MARKANPALLGAFVLGAVVLAVAALVVFGGGKFFRATQPWVAYFDESIKGLAIGAPVTFRGVRVGTVTDIKVVLDPKKDEVRIPVFFELEADRITQLGGKDTLFQKDRPRAHHLFDQGLRAQLQTQSFVTGQLGINLDFFPHSPMRLVSGPWPYPECPTVPSAMASLGRSLDDLDTAQLAKDLRDIMQGAAHLLNGPELKSALAAANAALTGVNRLVANADARITSLGGGLDKASARAAETLDAVHALVKRVDGQTVAALNETLKDASALVRNLDGKTVTEVNDTLKAARQLVQRVDDETVPAANQILADLRPLVEEMRGAATVARGALEQAEATLATVDGAMEERSPLRHEVRVTLREVAGAARAFRVLSNYLERNPDSVIFGKNSR
jgi:paraquat-inducible protein B